MFAQILFILSALLAVAGALMVVFSRDIMHACIYLLASLVGVAGLYLTLGADFLAATQLVVYVGGVIILMLFAIMLTGGGREPSEKMKLLMQVPLMGSPRTYVLSFLALLVLSLTVGKLFVRVMEGFSSVDKLPYMGTVDSIGTLLVTKHVLAFEISSVLLLGALVGAAVIARPNKKRGAK